MDERLLHEMRRDPDPVFARDLRERLRRDEERAIAPPRRTGTLFAAAAAAAAVVALITVPSVRSSAEALLDLFRVRKFAAVPFDASRVETIRAALKEDVGTLFEHEETLREPGPRQYVASLDAAATAGGIRVSTPSYLPEGLARDSTFVGGEGAMRVQVSEARLRDVLDRLDLRDVSLPSGIDGKWIEVRKPPVVIQRFRGPTRRAVLMQSRSPEVSMPAGMDIERLAEVGLRVLGLDHGEARRLARATDWRSTLVVPVPMNASTFRQVTIHGRSGLLVTTSGEPGARGPNRGKGRDGTIVLWTDGDRVFGLQTDLRAPIAMQIAESVR